MGWGQPVDRTSRFIAKQAVERMAKRARVDRIETALAGKQRRQPFIDPRDEGGVGQIGDRRIVRGGESGPATEGNGAIAPRKDCDAMTPDSLQQASLDRRLIGLGSGAEEVDDPSLRPLVALIALGRSKRTLVKDSIRSP